MNFYTYMWLREDGTPYYVGKGTGNRAFISGRHHGLRRPKSSARIFVQYWESEAKSFEIEKWYISLFGRKDNNTGILHNLTDGGEGSAGVQQSKESRLKKSLALLGRPHSESRIKNIKDGLVRSIVPRRGHSGKTHSKESREKMSHSLKGRRVWNIGKPWDDVVRKKMSDAHKGKPAWNKGMQGSRLTEETKRKMSDAQWQRHHIFII